MLKKYMAPNRLRLVGKAWEIRHALRQEFKLRGGQSLITALVTESGSMKRQRPGKA